MPKGIYKRTEETKRKMSEAHEGSKHSDETKRKMSQSQKGCKNGMFGKHHSQNTRKKMSQSHKNIFVGEKSPSWKGGHSRKGGRILIKTPEHPCTQNHGYVLRSRLVMEKILGRYLKPCEVVHHINGVVDDDRPENLQLFPNQSIHVTFHNRNRSKTRTYPILCDKCLRT